jgi:DNA-binding winged helix-turn-helix (wHTH) protein
LLEDFLDSYWRIIDELSEEAMPRPEKRFYEFGPFRLDITTRVLLRESEIVPLTPKALDILLALIERRGELVGRKELLDAVWPDVHVEEGNLNSNIFLLRKVLGEDNDGKDYIVTIPRRGYRFVAGVCEIVVGQTCHEKTFHPTTRKTQSVIPSLAVLPFKTLCAEGCDQELGLGLADALITRLSNLSEVTVRPTSAISRYRGLEQDPAIAGNELGVEIVLEGGIQIAGGRVRVTVQLVSVADGASVWAEKFDENFSDIFSVEDAISARVAEALIDQLGGDKRTPHLKCVWNNLNMRLYSSAQLADCAKP